MYVSSPLYQESKQHILEKLFLESNRFLGELGVEYWLNYGTLLGYYRSKSLIPHDIDIDFGARENDVERIWEHRNKLPKGFTMYDSSNRHYGPKLYISYKGFDADIYFYNEQETFFEPYEKTHWKNYRIPIPRSCIIPLEPVTFLGQPTYIPKEPLTYLQTFYGSLAEDAVRNPDSGLWEKNE